MIGAGGTRLPTMDAPPIQYCRTADGVLLGLDPNTPLW
jgi:hypothetical protein